MKIHPEMEGQTMDFINDTPYEAATFPLRDHTNAENLLIVLKGTWAIGNDGKLGVADEQVPILLSPVYHGDYGTSSLRYDSDICLRKLGTDCVLIGHAWAPHAGVPHLDVTFAVGPVRRQARVFGDRKWLKRRFGPAVISRGAPFESMPLTWEHSFGGADASWPDAAGHEICPENPVGRGMVAARSRLDLEGILLPNIENPADLIQKTAQHPKPWGFGMIPPQWLPRTAYAGTYGEQWRRDLCPLPPSDLDARFYSTAAPGLCTETYLAGAEPVFVEGACRRGVLGFELPGIKPRASIRGRQMNESLALELDTVIVEPDEARLVLVWRGSLTVHGRAQEIGSVRVRV